MLSPKMGHLCLAALTAGALFACNMPAPNAGKSVNAEAVDHRAIGLAAAATDFPGLSSLCGDPSPLLDRARVTARPWRMPGSVPAARVFDNLYFVGNQFSSAWVVKTNAGLILIDALMNDKEVQRDIEGGLVKLGLDSNDIRYLIVSHGHGDHSGGAAYLGKKYDPKVIMSRTDWETSQDAERGMQLPGWNDVPQPAILVDDEYDLTLGDTTIKLVVTPGHTLGTVSTILTVNDGAASHKAVLWGGTGFNFGPKAAQYEAYSKSAFAMRQRVQDENISIFLSNHVRRDQTDKNITALADRKEGESHPFVSTPQRTSKAFTVFGECALAQLDALRAGKSE